MNFSGFLLSVAEGEENGHAQLREYLDLVPV